jgi:hypothetical protein
MRTQITRVVGTSIVSLALLAGLAYSVLALTPKRVYASSCNCTEEESDANTFCYVHGLVGVDPNTFECFPADGYYYFSCLGGGDPFYFQYCD